MASAVLSSQLLISAAMLVLIVAILVFDPAALSNPGLFAGLGLIFVLTALAALVPWGSISKSWGVLLPLLNIVALIAVRESAPSLGAGLMLVFPIIWLARSFGVRETAFGFSLAVLLVWGTRAINPQPLAVGDFGALVLLPIMLAFVATTISVSTARSRAQTVLLRQHSRFIESALDKARRQEEIRDAVLNAVEFGVIAFDRTGRVTFVNRWQRHALADFGTSPDAVVHPVVFQADQVTPYPESERPFTRALAGQSFDNLILWVGEPGGRRAAYAATSRALRDREGGYDGGVVVLRDVTTELEAIRARDDLVGSVTHELRSPLTSILGYLDLARDDDALSAETRKMLDVAASNSERLLVIVTDLLRAASDADKRLEMSFVACDIAEIARESVEAHQLYADDHDVELLLEADDEAPANADPVRIRQVIDNLVTNAIKYNREWGTATVAVSSTETTVTVEVRDSGQGIPKKDLARIFDRFYRTNSARNSETVGTGLGLSITREIAHRHGGELAVESEFGLGSTFRLTLPIARLQESVDDAENERPVRA